MCPGQYSQVVNGEMQKMTRTEPSIAILVRAKSAFLALHPLSDWRKRGPSSHRATFLIAWNIAQINNCTIDQQVVEKTSALY